MPGVSVGISRLFWIRRADSSVSLIQRPELAAISEAAWVMSDPLLRRGGAEGQAPVSPPRIRLN